MSTRKEHWENVFTTKDEQQVSWFQESPEPSLSLLERFCRNKNAPLIDIGAGASRLPDALVGRGHTDITLLDISSSALAISKARLAGSEEKLNYIVSDITRFKPENTWQLWHDRAVFHFLTDEDDQQAYLKVLNAATTPGAIIIFGTFGPDGPEKCSGLPVQRYSPESLSQRLGAGFELLQGLEHTHFTPGGGAQKFSFAVFRRL